MKNFLTCFITAITVKICQFGLKTTNDTGDVILVSIGLATLLFYTYAFWKDESGK